jgi:3-(3-hydroxy-phenyl)propionate hydroxylase
MLGIEMEGYTYEKKWLIIDLKGTRDNFRQTRVYCDPGRPGINLPGPHRTRRFEFMLFDDETEEQVTDPDFVRRLLRDHGPDEDAEIVRKQVYTFHARMATRWQQGSVFLLGDAAHLTPPFAGQGLNSGLRDAANLAWKLAAVVRGQTGPAVLDSYAQERSEHAWELIEFAIKLGRIMMPGSKFKARLIQAGFRALRLAPPVNDYIAQMRYKPKPRFSAGFFVGDRESPRRTRVGRMIPQPRVETEDRMSHPLDEILGPGFALIAVHQDPSLAFEGMPHLPFEERLNLRRVCFTPRFWNPFPSASGMVTVRDMQGDFVRHCPGAEEAWLLVRPDRYVAACIPHRGGQGLAEQLDRMFMA